jgi:primosomal protein N' (replication factor Y)
VIIQTLNPDHYALTTASMHDFEGFYQKEVETRKELGLPPFGRLALIRISSEKEEDAEKHSDSAAEILNSLAKSFPPGEAEVLGPAPSPFYQLAGRWRQQIMLRTSSVQGRLRILKSFAGPFRRKLPKELILTVDVDPYHMM